MIILLSSCSLTVKEPRDLDDAVVKISQIRGSVYLVEDTNYWKTNSVMYLNDSGAVFVNAGWSDKSAKQILWFAAARTLVEFNAVVPVSYKLHHTGGLNAFTRERVPVMISTRTQKLMRNKWEEMQNEMMSFGTWRKKQLPESEKLFETELTLMGGAVKIFFPGPASTEDNLFVYFPEEKILYGGDAISDPAYFLDPISGKEYRQTLQKALGLPFTTVVSGHGKPIQDRTFLLARIAAIKD
ncbi:MAG: MBL fold metallo-hydrolase [Spirochaetia bacterium]|nr:MBL fold metallo-hydrolase [Spirochaetia bacterium]